MTRTRQSIPYVLVPKSHDAARKDSGEARDFTGYSESQVGLDSHAETRRDPQGHAPTWLNGKGVDCLLPISTPRFVQSAYKNLPEWGHPGSRAPPESTAAQSCPAAVVGILSLIAEFTD